MISTISTVPKTMFSAVVWLKVIDVSMTAVWRC